MNLDMWFKTWMTKKKKSFCNLSQSLYEMTLNILDYCFIIDNMLEYCFIIDNMLTCKIRTINLLDTWIERKTTKRACLHLESHFGDIRRKKKNCIMYCHILRES